MLGRVEHDFYHLPSYVELCAKRDGGAPRALLVEDGARSLLVPFVERRIDEARWDATTPYGYPGPLVDGPDPDRFASDALDTARITLRERGCVSLFLRLHPLLGATPRPVGGHLVQHGTTIAVDLSKSTEEMWSETTSGHRSEILRSVKKGHRAWFDERFEHAERFVEIYLATMARVEAAAPYLFDRAYLDGLRAALGGRLKLGLVSIEEKVVAAALFVATGRIVQYHLSGTDDAFLRERPTKLLLHFVRGWAKERGSRWFHLGGGVGGGEDSLFKFKAGFSRHRSAFHTLRVVVDPDEYATLVRMRAPGADPTDLSGFFPLYRRA